MERTLGQRSTESDVENPVELAAGPAPPGGARVVPRLTAASAYALQRAAGNRAVSALVSRDPAPAAPPAPGPAEPTWNPFAFLFGFLPRAELSMRPPPLAMPTDAVHIAVNELWTPASTRSSGVRCGTALPSRSPESRGDHRRHARRG